MGVMSRRVLPACGNLCYICPSMRARSRQPIKRYKKLLTEIFPRSQDGQADDRKISKLCEYAARNPLRIPEITEYLEQRCFKELRNEHFGQAKVVMCIYRKLLASCKEQMPLYASSLLCIIRTLLDQTRQDGMRILACHALVDFINCQMDSTYMFNLEGLIPKLCQLANEVGQDERGLCLRSAGLQAVASMVWFMGEYSHVLMDFDDIISVTLENYEDSQTDLESSKIVDDHGSSFLDIRRSLASLQDFVDTKPALDDTIDNSKCPTYWSRICLQNMAMLAKEATTVRRILEPLFHNFDSGNHWRPEKGLARSVLSDIQLLMEKSGEKPHLLLSMLVKHLDHKNVMKEPRMQIDILKVTTLLAEHSKPQASVAIITAISDLIRHLRKCMQSSIESSEGGDGVNEWNASLHFALEECLVQLSNKVGDVGPILDMMAVTLENIPTNSVVSRTTMSAIYRTAQIVASVPNVSYYRKAFPEALFHQLLLVMAHPDHETQVGAHRVLSVVLVPSLASLTVPPFLVSPKESPHQALSIALSGFSSASILEKVGEMSLSAQDASQDSRVESGATDEGNEGTRENHFHNNAMEGCQTVDYDVKHYKAYPSHSQHCSIKLSPLCSVKEGRTVAESKKEELTSLRLSSRQVGLLLSSIWAQATSPENTPTSFEAMAQTYNLALMFSRSKTSSHAALARCFQLAFSLRSISLEQNGSLQHSHRRSLFTLASSMLIFSAKAANLLELIPSVKAKLMNKTVDPYLHLIEDSRLQAIHTSDCERTAYGSEEDEAAALKSLSAVEMDGGQLKETVVSHFMKKCRNLPEEELLGIKMQLQQEFSPDDTFPLGAPLFMEISRPCSPLAQEYEYYDEIMPAASLTDEDAFFETSGSQLDCKPSLSMNAFDVLSVNQLIESVLEAACQVVSFPVSSTPVSYNQMKNQCEALVVGKQQKMSVLLSFKQQLEPVHIMPMESNEEKGLVLSHVKATKFSVLDDKSNELHHVHFFQPRLCSSDYEQSFRLPPASPYDKFLKAAGC